MRHLGVHDVVFNYVVPDVGIRYLHTMIYGYRARYSCLRCRVRYPVIHDVEFYYVVPDIVPDIAPDVFYIGIYGDRARY